MKFFYNGLSKSFEYLNLLDTALILRQWLEISLFLKDNDFSPCLSHQQKSVR